MRILTAENDTLLDIDLRIEKATSMCDPCIKIGNIQIEGPKTKLTCLKDKETSGLIFEVSLPDLTTLKILVEKEDVRKMRGLMNKEAISFMIKAFM